MMVKGKAQISITEVDAKTSRLRVCKAAKTKAAGTAKTASETC